MVGPLTKSVLAGAACTALIVAGNSNPGLLSAMVGPAMPSIDHEIPGPSSAIIPLAIPSTDQEIPGLSSAMLSPAIPSAGQPIPNPLRGQYEDLLQPLFPQGNPAQQRYPAWPAAHDASLRVSWRQLQPTDPRTLPPDAADDRKFDFSVIDDALAKLAGRNMRLTLRVYSYNSCCDASLSEQHQYRCFPTGWLPFPGPLPAIRGQ